MSCEYALRVNLRSILLKPASKTCRLSGVTISLSLFKQIWIALWNQSGDWNILKTISYLKLSAYQSDRANLN